MILSQSLSQFESMSIESLMDRAELMDRTDRKFVFHRKLLSDILNDCANEYRILEMQGQRMFEYERNISIRRRGCFTFSIIGDWAIDTRCEGDFTAVRGRNSSR
jgi:hypothetical protein